MKTNPWPIKNFNTLLSKAIRDFLAPGSRKTKIGTKNFINLKIASFIKKLLKFVMLKR